MGACYSCNGCGKCREWMKDLEHTCPICRTPVEASDTRCPNCSRPLPLPAGIVQQNKNENQKTADQYQIR